MPTVHSDELHRSIAIWLRLAPQAPRVAYAARNPDHRDEGANAIARVLCDKLVLAGWTLQRPEPNPNHSTGPHMRAARGE